MVLPDLVYKPDLKSVPFEYADHEMIMAHEKEEINKPQFNTKKEKTYTCWTRRRIFRKRG